MIEPPLGRDDVILIYHRKKAELINSYFVVFSTFLLEQWLGTSIFSTKVLSLMWLKLMVTDKNMTF